MPPAVIARVNLFGKNEPSILTFTDRHDREIGDPPQDYEPSGNDDDSVVKLISDVIPGLVITHKTMSLVGMMTTLLSDFFWK
jgi:hypothetical protein